MCSGRRAYAAAAPVLSMVISSNPADPYGGCHGAIGLIGHSNAGAQCSAVYRELAGIEMGKPGRAVVAAKPP